MHQTVRDFFLDTTDQTTRNHPLLITSAAHLEISEICVAYIRTFVMGSSSNSTWQHLIQNWQPRHFVDISRFLQTMPFARYALRYVEQHLELCAGEDSSASLASRLAAEFGQEPFRTMLSPLAHRLARSIEPMERILSTARFRRRLFYHAVQNNLPTAMRIVAEIHNDWGKLLVLQNFGRDKRNKNQTALHLASYSGYLDIVIALLDIGANPNAQQQDGQSPLHLAALRGHESVAKELIDAGAQVYLENSFGEVPLDLASRNGHLAVVKTLLVEEGHDESSISARRGGYILEALIRAVEYRHEDVAKALAEFKIGLTDSLGATALHHAAKVGSEALVRFFIDRCGIDPSQTDDSGLTALDWALYFRKDDVMHLL